MSALGRTTLAVVAAFVLLGTTLGGAYAAGPMAAGVHPSSSNEFVNISATTQFQFSPDQITVAPGSTVHLAVTNLASTLHTFVLSSVANLTIPPTDSAAQLTAFFALHPPLVNLSLGQTKGTVTTATFTAPAIGSYEFVCLVPTHFQSGMHGTMQVANPSSSSSGLSMLEIAAIAVVIILVIAVIALVALRGRKTTPPPVSAPPARPPTEPPTPPTPPQNPPAP